MTVTDWPDQDTTGDVDGEVERALAFNRAVSEEAERIRVRNAAQDRVRTENEPAGEPFDAGTLAELLARPDAPAMRVDGLIPADASTLLVAQRKAGKTTLALNLARSLLTGEPFLGRFNVVPLAGTVALLNFEVSGHTVARWAREHDLPVDRLVIVNLRGRRNPLAHPQDRARLAAYLRTYNAEAIIVDPFGRAFTGKSQNDAAEVGSWLVDLDLFVRYEVGATDLLLAAHAGWNGERSRGSSALEDWADVIITLTRDDTDDAPAYLRAIGRDVDLDEDRLDYDPNTRTLTLAGTGSRRQAKATSKRAELAVLVQRAAHQTPGINAAALVKAIRDMDDAPAFRDHEVRDAAKYAADVGAIRIESDGPGRPSRHFTTETLTPSNPVQTPSTDTPGTPSTPSLYGRGGGSGSKDNPDQPPTLDGVVIGAQR